MRIGLIKRTVFVTVAVVIASLLLCSCGETDQERSDISKGVLPTEQINATVEPSDSNENIERCNLLTYTYKVPLKNVYIDAPDYHFISEGFTVVYMEEDVKYFAITYDTSLSSTELSEAFKKNFGIFKASMVGHDLINKINDDVKEQAFHINGIDYLKCEGSLNCGDNPIYNAFMTSYTFILDNTSCTIWGVVMDEAQKEIEISDVNSIVEEMVKTVRDHQ